MTHVAAVDDAVAGRLRGCWQVMTWIVLLDGLLLAPVRHLAMGATLITLFGPPWVAFPNALVAMVALGMVMLFLRAEPPHHDTQDDDAQGIQEGEREEKAVRFAVLSWRRAVLLQIVWGAAEFVVLVLMIVACGILLEFWMIEPDGRTVASWEVQATGLRAAWAFSVLGCFVKGPAFLMAAYIRRKTEQVACCGCCCACCACCSCRSSYCCRCGLCVNNDDAAAPASAAAAMTGGTAGNGDRRVHAKQHGNTGPKAGLVAGQEPQRDGEDVQQDGEETREVKTSPFVFELTQEAEAEGFLPVTHKVRQVGQAVAAAELLCAFLFFWVLLGNLLYLGSSQFKSVDDYDNCDPNVERICALPFPSSYWLKESSKTVTGYEVAMGDRTLPYTRQRRHIPPFINGYDGFSRAGTFLWYVENLGSIRSKTDLVPHTSIGRSLDVRNSTTLLIDASTGELVPHFTEIDDLLEDGWKIAMTQAAHALKFQTRYVLVVQNLTDKATGKLLDASPRTSLYVDTYLRTNGSTEAPDDDDTLQKNEPERYEYFAEHVLPVVEAAGVNWAGVQLIFDSITGSNSSLLGGLQSVATSTPTRMRQELQDAGANVFRLTSLRRESCPVADNPKVFTTTRAAVTAHFTMRVPWFLHSQSRKAKFRGDLERLTDAQMIKRKVPMVSNDVGVAVTVPCSIYREATPIRGIMTAGHGLFWSREMASSKFVREIAGQAGLIVVASDWRGLSQFDLPVVARSLMHAPDTMARVADNIRQSFANNIAVMIATQTLLESHRDVLGIPASANLTEVAMQRTYYGYSLGGIFGAGFTAYVNSVIAELEFDRIGLIVPGSPIAFLMGRSSSLSPYLSMTAGTFFNRRDVRLWLTVTQTTLDEFESTGWALGDGSDDPVGAWDAPVLLQTALGDSVVSTIAGDILSRNMNASAQLPRAPEAVHYDMPVVETPFKLAQSGHQASQATWLFEKDYDDLDPHDSGPPNDWNLAHFCLKDKDPFIEQSADFLGNGTVMPGACGDVYCASNKATCVSF